MIQFLLDAQLSRQLATQLLRAGHSASHVFDHIDPQADDRDIAQLANKLGACVISKDSDFVDLADRGLLEHTLVWLRMYNLDNNALWQRVERALPDIVKAVEENRPIVEVY